MILEEPLYKTRLRILPNSFGKAALRLVSVFLENMLLQDTVTQQGMWMANLKPMYVQLMAALNALIFRKLFKMANAKNVENIQDPQLIKKSAKLMNAQMNKYF